MAWTFELRWGTRTLDLNASPFAVKDFSIRLAEPNVMEHAPDFGAREVLRLLPTDRVVTLRMQIDAANAAAVADALTDLKLLIDGPNQIASDESHAPVYFAFDRDGGNGVMLHRVKWGNVEDGYSHFRTPASSNNKAIDVAVTLIVPEAGEAATTIQLKNYMKDGDFTKFASNISIGWNDIGTGSPTFAQNTTNWLVGGSSQKITAAGANEGLKSDVIAAGTAATYTWVNVTAGSAVIALYDDLGGSIINSGTITTSGGADSDKTATDNAGATWYRVSNLASVSNSNLTIRAYAVGGAGTFSIDAAYFETAGTATPDAWASYFAPANYMAEVDRTTANPERVSYIDIWGVPGDMPAWLTTYHDLSLSGMSLKKLYMGAVTDKRYLAADQTNYFDENDSRITYDNTGFTAGTVAAGSAIGGTANTQYNAGAAEMSLEWVPTDIDDGLKLLATPRRVIAHVNFSSGGTVQAFDHNSIALGDKTTVGSAAYGTALYAIECGVLNYVGALDPDHYDTSTALPAASFANAVAGLKITFGQGGGTIMLDGIQLQPIEQSMAVNAATGAFLASSDFFGTNGKDNRLQWEAFNTEAAGMIRTVEPGNKSTRIYQVYTQSGTEDLFRQDQGAAITLTVTPRARLLLGSQTNLRV